MSLSLPYFKMDVIDWLKSETIEQLSTAQVGAYILLLCEAWTRPSCSLPARVADLMRLARWTETEQAFAPLLSCFEPMRGDRSRLINPRLKREWDHAQAMVVTLREAGKKGAQIKEALRHQHPTPLRTAARHPPRRTTDTETTFESFWQAYPKKTGKKAAQKAWTQATDKPPIAEILHAIQAAAPSPQWTKDAGRYIPNPATWLNQGRWTDQPLSHDQALTHCGPCNTDYPDAAALTTHQFLYHPKYEG